jgi:hypothetical protein
MFCVLIEFHPMTGMDFHFDLIPPSPAPIPTPFEPHMVGALLNWSLPASMADKVLAMYGRVMQRGTDIQMGIPHIPCGPGIVMSPAETLFSGSKSYFGPASVQGGGKPIAVALLVLVNLNLNCGTIPTPTGQVTAPNTVVAGMTLGDFLGGLFAMAFDCVLQTCINIILSPLGGIGGGIVGMFIGSPLGFSFNSNGKGAVGFVGRIVGDCSDACRAWGEQLGGDKAQGDADLAAVRKALNEEKDFKPNPFIPGDGWNVFGKDGDASKVLQAPLPLRPFTNGAVDNPLAEHF